MDRLKVNKDLGVRHNVTFNVIDQATGKIVRTHQGHNSATNGLLVGIGYYLTGEGILNQGYPLLSQFIPRYISLGTMGLLNQEESSTGLPIGIGCIDYTSFTYHDLPTIDKKFLDVLQSDGSYKGYVLLEEEPIDWDTNRTFYWRWVSGDTYVHVSSTATFSPNTYYVLFADNAPICEDHIMILRYNDYMKQCPGFGADGYDINANNNRPELGIGKRFADWRSTHPRSTVNCELISSAFPRVRIAFRDVVPEIESERPETIDVVFSAMISTGALAQFREPGKDYIFITEAGLWASKDWEKIDRDSLEEVGNYDYTGYNGLLAGYRIAPPDSDNWDMRDSGNRAHLDRQIIRVARNQVVQVIWKIQLGSLKQLTGLDKLYDPGLRWWNWAD